MLWDTPSNKACASITHIHVSPLMQPCEPTLEKIDRKEYNKLVSLYDLGHFGLTISKVHIKVLMNISRKCHNGTQPSRGTKRKTDEEQIMTKKKKKKKNKNSTDILIIIIW